MISIEEFKKLPLEKRRADAINSMWEMVERSVTEIARARRTAEITFDIRTEDFDTRLNEMCAKANDRFCNMTEKEMAMDMLKELITHVDSKDLPDFFGIR